jgi:hypothetical protein
MAGFAVTTEAPHLRPPLLFSSGQVLPWWHWRSRLGGTRFTNRYFPLQGPKEDTVDLLAGYRRQRRRKGGSKILD